MTIEIQNFIIQKKIEALRFTVSYYKNSYLPEISEYTGSSQIQHQERAEEALQSFLIDVQDYRRSQRFDLLSITDNEKINYTRLYAIEQRELARDFPDNPWIKIKSLKNAVRGCKALIEMIPALEIYSYHWLASRNAINM